MIESWKRYSQTRGQNMSNPRWLNVEKEWNSSVRGWLPGRGHSQQRFRGADQLVNAGTCLTGSQFPCFKRRVWTGGVLKPSMCPRILLFQYANLSLCKNDCNGYDGSIHNCCKSWESRMCSMQGSWMCVHLSWREMWLRFAEHMLPSPFPASPSSSGSTLQK